MGVIASGYNAELDEWRALADGAVTILKSLKFVNVKNGVLIP